MSSFTTLVRTPAPRAFAVLLGVVLACARCSSGGGGGDASGTSYSCSVTALGAVQDCSLYEDVTASQVAGLQSGCTASGISTFSTDACPEAGVTGCCTNTLAGTDFTEVECSYTAAGATALKTQCAAEKGTWSATM